jgi:hypothetical protein
MMLLSVAGSISGLIAWVIEELTYLISIVWMPILCQMTVGCLDFSAPMLNRMINSGIGSGIDGALDWLLQTFLVPYFVGVERVCMPYMVEILQQVFNILG